MSDDEPLRQARELIKQKKWEEARHILRQISHNPVAAKWLEKLDEMQPPLSQKHPSSTQWNVLGVMLLSLLILIIVSGFSFWLGRQSAGNSLVEYQATVEAIRTQIVQEYIATLQGVFNSGPSDIDLTVTAVYATNTAVAEFLDATETAAAVATLAPSK